MNGESQQTKILTTGLTDAEHDLIARLPAMRYEIAHLEPAKLLSADQHKHAVLILIGNTLSMKERQGLCQHISGLSEPRPQLLITLTTRDIKQAYKLLDAGADDYIVFPTSEALLQKRIESLLCSSKTKSLSNQSLDLIPDAVIISDNVGKITAVNKALSSLLDYKQETLLEMDLFDLVDSNEHSWLLSRLRDIGSNGSEVFRSNLRRSDSTPIVVEIHARTSDENRYTYVIRDLSERQKLEHPLTDQTYRYLFDSANDAIMIVDMFTGRFLDVNKNALRWLGYTHDEFLASTFELIHVPLDPADQRRIEVGLSTTGRLIYEQAFRRKNGGEIPVEVSSRVINYAGRRAFLNVARDIRERRAMEEQERVQRHLAEAFRDSITALSSTLDLDTILKHMLELVESVVPADAANVAYIKDGTAYSIRRQRVEGAFKQRDWKTARLTVENTPTFRWMSEHKKALCIPNVREFAGWISTEDDNWIRSYLGAPIMIDGEVIGFINLDSTQEGQYDEQQAENLQAFANQAAIAVRNARLYETIQQHADELEARVAERTGELLKANRILEEQIEERVRAEVRVEEERNLLRTLIDNLPDDVYVKDVDGRYQVINKPLERRLRRYREDIEPIGARASAYLPFEREERWQAEEQEVLRSGRSLINQEILTIDPATRHKQTMLVTRVPLYDRRGNTVGLVGVSRDVTELRGAEENLRHVVTSANCLLWYGEVTRRADNSLHWDSRVSNEEAARHFLPIDVQGGQSYHHAWHDSILSEDRQHIDKIAYDALISGESEYNREFRCRVLAGDIRWLYEEVRVTRLDDGYWSVVGVCTDITARKEVAAALRRARDELENRVQERTAALTEANAALKEEIAERERVQQAEHEQRILAQTLRDVAADLSATLDINTVLDRILKHIAHVMPVYDSASILLIEDETHANVIRFQRRKANTIETTPRDTRILYSTLPNFVEMKSSRQPIAIPDTAKNEHWRNDRNATSWIESYIGAPIQAGGEVIGFINLASETIHTFNDDHANRLLSFANQVGIAIQNARLYDRVQRHAEELQMRVTERTVELEHERARLNAILDALTEGVIYYDSEGQPTYTNRSLSQLTGFSDEQLRSPEILQNLALMPKDELASLRQTITTTLEGIGLWRGEIRVRRMPNKEFDASLTTTTVTNPDGESIGSVMVIRDISLEKQLEAQKARFIANASHELRTPITNIKTRLYLIKRQPEKLSQHLDIIEAVTNRMRGLVEDLLDMSRFEHGMIILEPEVHALQDVIQDVVQIQQAEAEKKSIQLIASMPDNALQASIDMARFIQVLTNLINNAINYTPADGKIQVELVDDGDAAVIYVRDNGPGIAADQLADIFKPFFRATTNNKGAGLGLSITREIVELHGGSIDVSSQVDVGTTFRVRLKLES